MKIPLLVLKNFFIVYTTAWAFIASLSFFNILSNHDYSWYGALAHLITSMFLSFVLSLDFLFNKNKASNSKNNFEGKWNSEIFDDQGNNTKSDIWDFKIIDGYIMSGKIKRNQPKEDKAREWFLSGYLVNGEMHVAFTQTDQAGRSHGCALLKKKIDQDYVFEGFYFKFNDKKPYRVATIKLIKNKKS